MRIACVHIPQLSLQCVTRVEAALRGAALAVAGSRLAEPAAGDGRVALTAPVVTAVSRAAWSLGVRLGMTAVAARAVGTDVRLVHADPAAERELVRGVADALLTIAPTVDLGGRLGPGGAHLAIYVEVPARLRGSTFGDRALEILQALGLTGRVGIADDRFTAWVAACSPPANSDDSAVTSVPRGGATAYLAGKPLSLLAITPEVQRMLEALGVRTLGEFAMLPAPSVARPIERDYQALARGEGGTQLRPYAPEAVIFEEIALRELDAVGELARRVALRLAGRVRLASRLEVTSFCDVGERTETVALANAVATAGELTSAITSVVARGAWRVRATVSSEAIATDVEVATVAAPPTPMLDVVLATTGTADLFGDATQTPTGALGRYRRTRRGKQRTRTERSQARLQSQLFERS